METGNSENGMNLVCSLGFLYAVSGHLFCVFQNVFLCKSNIGNMKRGKFWNFSLDHFLFVEFSLFSCLSADPMCMF